MNSYRYPLATWLGPVPNSNFDLDRIDTTTGIQHSMQWISAADPSYIVIHTEVGHNTGATGRFKNPASQVSATYGVGLDGSIVQWVDEKDAPYADGNWDYNLNSIAIEHEDNSVGGVYAAGYTDAQYQASGELVRDIASRYGIPLDRKWIIKHLEVPGSSTSCPDEYDIDRMIAVAAGTWQAPNTKGVVEDTVMGVFVTGQVFAPATYYLWSDIVTGMLTLVNQTRAIGPATYTDAVRVNGVWYDRTTKVDGTPGEFCISDLKLDTNGTTPADHRLPTPVPVILGTRIMGANVATQAQMETLLFNNGVLAPYAQQLVQAYISGGKQEGVRADVALAQAIHETGYFKFGGDVKREQNNFAGLGATGGVPGLSFPTIDAGARAHLRHLRLYATTDVIVDDGVDPRGLPANLRGVAPTLKSLGGHWAPSLVYGDALEVVLAILLAVVVPPVPVPPPAPVIDVALTLRVTQLEAKLARLKDVL